MKRYKKIILSTGLALLFTGVTALAKDIHIAKSSSLNPHRAYWLNGDMVRTIESIKRQDGKGWLYYMECDSDYYYSPEIVKLFFEAFPFESGCSTFYAQNRQGDGLTGRNYDYRHYDKNGDLTGLNVVIKCTPPGRYKSLGIVDAYWLDAVEGKFTAGVLDDGSTDISKLALAPYCIMDGLNEKGLSVSILNLELPPGEKCANQEFPDRDPVVVTMMMRYILDNCATVKEAQSYINRYNLKGGGTAERHLFVTDNEGNSTAFEWRGKEFKVIPTDALTNFFAGYDDGQDYLKNGLLQEKFTKLTGTVRPYRYGFGYGYHRFAGIVSSLERYYEDHNAANPIAKMTEEQAKDILRQASQNPQQIDGSMTQYSALYNAGKSSCKIWLHGDYDKTFYYKI